jgi:uncharacterized protein
MRREEVIARIRAHEAELRAMGVAHLALFGSVARGDDRPDSDVDVLIDVEEAFRIGGYVDVTERLTGVLGHKVDVVMRGAVKPRFAQRIADDLVEIF